MKPNYSIYKVIKKLLICIVVGVFTSVGVSWVAVVSYDYSNFWGPAELYRTAQSEPYQQFWQSKGFAIVAHYKLYDNPYHKVLGNATLDAASFRKKPTWSVILPTPNDNVEDNNDAFEEAWGWPKVCMISVFKRDQSFGSTWKSVSGIPFGTRTQPIFGPRVLPIQPIWSGLLVNTSIYAIPAWFVLARIIQRRNLHLRKRGICIHCRYNVRDLPTCPECGSEVVST